MERIQLLVNGGREEIEVPPEMPLLWALRDELNLTGTKYSCGTGQCGACTVLVDGDPVQSCISTAASVSGKSITTIEGLDSLGGHPVQQAWQEGNVPQCGYCQSGQIMAAAALLQKYPSPTDEHINQAMSQILCRCGTYQRIRQAIHRAAELGGA